MQEITIRFMYEQKVFLRGAIVPFGANAPAGPLEKFAMHLGSVVEF
jgi:hypothetical protein